MNVQNRITRSAWWWGTIIGVFFITLLPYWIWNASAAYGAGSMFRIPVLPNVVFDSYLYFQQMGMLNAGINTGAFSWLAGLLAMMMKLMPLVSIPEIWVVTRFVATCLAFWIGAWYFHRVTDAGKGISRWIMVCFWLSFLPAIGLRPGMSSWYLPFALLGFGLIALVDSALEKKQWVRAIVLSVAAVGALSVWPWFFLFGATFIATLFAVKLLQINRTCVYSLLATVVLGICAVAVAIASGILSFHAPASFYLYERNGIGFGYVPLISNTILASFIWLWLLYRSGVRRVHERRHAQILAWSWIVMLALWLSPPLVGLDILNDHFVIVASILSWASLGYFVFQRGDEHPSASRPGRRVSLGIAIFASLFFCYILQKALRHLGKFDPYGIHLSIWLALMSAGWFCVLRTSEKGIAFWWGRLRWALLLVSVLLGAFGLNAVIRRGMPEMVGLWERLPVIVWLQNNVPTGDAVCSDPASARIYGAHAGRITYPEDANLMLPEADEVQHQRLVTIGSVYDTFGAKDDSMFPFLINGVRANACDQFSRPGKLLLRMGMSEASVNRIIGCRRDRAEAFTESVMEAMKTHAGDPEDFRALCPWVVIPDDHKAFWTLPGEYEEIRATEHTSVWRRK